MPRNELPSQENLNEGFKVELVAGVVVKTQLDPNIDQEMNNETEKKFYNMESEINNIKNKNEDIDDTIFINKAVKDNVLADSHQKNRKISENPLTNENLPNYNNGKARLNSDLGETNCCMLKGPFKDSSSESFLLTKGNKEPINDCDSKEVVLRSGYLVKQGYHVKIYNFSFVFSIKV